MSKQNSVSWTIQAQCGGTPCLADDLPAGVARLGGSLLSLFVPQRKRPQNFPTSQNDFGKLEMAGLYVLSFF
jgi:hypothetical protein